MIPPLRFSDAKQRGLDDVSPDKNLDAYDRSCGKLGYGGADRNVAVHVVQFCSLVRILASLQTYPNGYHSLSEYPKKMLLVWTTLQVLGLFYIDAEMSLR